MKTTKTILFAILMFTLTTGCGEGISNKTPRVPFYTPENFSTMKNELEKAQFYCASATECPSNVGLLYIKSDAGEGAHASDIQISQCTGFLIADDIVATNSHCLTDRLKAPGTKCESQIAIRFLKDHGQKAIFGCKEILDFSTRTEVPSPDYAFIKIEPTGIAPLPLHKGGMKDNQKLVVNKVTPVTSPHGGRLETDSCKLGLNTFLNVKSTNSWSRTGVALGCKGQGGNSGSPMLNENGEVVGILQGEHTEAYRRYIETLFSRYDIQLPSLALRHLIFTSLSCVADPVTKIGNEQECKAGEKLTTFDCAIFDHEQSNLNEKKLYDKWAETLPKIFVYSLTSNEKNTTTVADPICVKTPRQLPDYKKYVFQKGPWGSRQENIRAIHTRAIRVIPQFTVNTEFRLRPEVRFIEKKSFTYEIDITRERDTWTGMTASVFSIDEPGFTAAHRGHRISLPDCSDDQVAAGNVNMIKTDVGIEVADRQVFDRNKTKAVTCER